MSVFDSAVKRINNLLGMTALGQTTKSGSLSTTRASDQVYLGVPIALTANGDIDTDAGEYRWVSVQLTALAGGLPISTFQVSNDGTTWVNQVLYISTSITTGGGVSSISGVGLYHGPLMGRYFRLHTTGITGGTHTGVIWFSAVPGVIQAHGVSASQTGTWTVQPGNTANTTAWKVDGSAVTQPVSAASLPLPAGAATAAKQPALGTAGSSSSDVISVQGIVSGVAVLVNGTFWPATQPVSAASLPLPAGAATETTVAAINTATGAQTDTAWATGNGSIIAMLKAIAAKIITALAVTQSGTWTVQPGNTANTTAWKVDGSAVTQPVSGTITNQATTLAADFSLTNGNTTGTTAGTPITGLGGYRTASVYVVLVGNTGGTLDIYLQWSPDGGTTWVDYAHLPQLAAGAGSTQRAFAVAKDLPLTTVATVGAGTTPQLAVNTVLGGDWGDRLRVVYVNGIGTSLGHLQTIKAIFST